MAKKKVERQLKLVIEAGKAAPAPPLGPALGQAGINIGDFVNQFNERTREMMGSKVRVLVNIYEDRSFDFEVKAPPTSELILKALGQKKGSGKNLVKKIGKLTRAQLEEIAKEKWDDLNARDMDAAVKIIEGTARSMGVEVVD